VVDGIKGGWTIGSWSEAPQI